jgi:hypothetical protein
MWATWADARLFQTGQTVWTHSFSCNRVVATCKQAGLHTHAHSLLPARRQRSRRVFFLKNTIYALGVCRQRIVQGRLRSDRGLMDECMSSVYFPWRVYDAHILYISVYPSTVGGWRVKSRVCVSKNLIMWFSFWKIKRVTIVYKCNGGDKEITLSCAQQSVMSRIVSIFGEDL